MGIGLFELLIILAAALVFIGPERLPKVAVEIAKFLRTCQTLMWDIRHYVSQRDIPDKPPEHSSERSS